VKKTTQKLKHGVYLLPNLFTTVNLFLGFYAIVITLTNYGNPQAKLFTMAAFSIVLAIVFDTLDGRIARLTKTTSQFGLQYDSLADLTSFGMAPALLLFVWGLKNFGKVGWLAVFLYFACVALRLARFNVQSSSVEKNSFQGLPCPAAAGFVASLVLIKPLLLMETKYEMLYILLIPYLLAFLLVSNVPYRNFKSVDFKRKFSFSVLLPIVALIIVIAYRPIHTIIVVFVVYCASGIVEEIVKWVLKKKKVRVPDQKEIPAPDNHS